MLKVREYRTNIRYVYGALKVLLGDMILFDLSLMKLCVCSCLVLPSVTVWNLLVECFKNTVLFFCMSFLGVFFVLMRDVVYSYFVSLLPLFFIVEDFHCVLHVSLFAPCFQDVCSITRHILIFVYGIQVLFEPGLNIHLVWLTCLRAI